MDAVNEQVGGQFTDSSDNNHAHVFHIYTSLPIPEQSRPESLPAHIDHTNCARANGIFDHTSLPLPESGQPVFHPRTGYVRYPITGDPERPSVEPIPEFIGNSTITRVNDTRRPTSLSSLPKPCQPEPTSSQPGIKPADFRVCKIRIKRPKPTSNFISRPPKTVQSTVVLSEKQLLGNLKSQSQHYDAYLSARGEKRRSFTQMCDLIAQEQLRKDRCTFALDHSIGEAVMKSEEIEIQTSKNT